MKKTGLIIALVLLTACLHAQNNNDSILHVATLQNCISYALKHQPVLKQAQIDEDIAETQIRAGLADWLPQVDLGYGYQHNFQVQTSVIGGNAVRLGVNNTSSISLGATQNIFNRDVLLATRTAGDLRRQAKESATERGIDVITNVSKAFYDVLLTTKQIEVLNEDSARLQRSLQDAYNQYQAGIVDKIDYKRATIELNNAKAAIRNNNETLIYKYAYLKEQMNYPASADLNLQYDSAAMVQETIIDTLQPINYENRIEYRLLETQRSLQKANVLYNKLSLLPELSAYANYNLNYQNNSFSKLYQNNYPNSYAGLRLSFPIFQGGKRIQLIRQAQLQLKRVDYDIIILKNNINTQYAQALAAYKSALNDYIFSRENLDISREVYNTIQLQYKAGIKAYLEVITSESDLVTSEVNYTNALYQLLSSKIDVQKALGQIYY